jgi:hypothetical protein
LFSHTAAEVGKPASTAVARKNQLALANSTPSSVTEDRRRSPTQPHSLKSAKLA